jgi:F-type H+-transporting ATPase subunit b
MDNIIFLLLSENEVKGGLFDIGGTLPLVAIEFLVLMFILNSILYNPLITFMNERDDYILDNLTKASKLLKRAEDLKVKYERELNVAKQEAQQEISTTQKHQKELFDNELIIAQKSIDDVVENSLKRLAEKKDGALNSLNLEIESISNQILKRIFTPRIKY